MTREAERSADDIPEPETAALGAALRRPGPSGRDQEEAALAAFRQARDTWPRRTVLRGPRSRDEWRSSRSGPRPRLSIRAALGALVASVTLGGVALAAGAGVLPQPMDRSGRPSGRPDAAPVRTVPRAPSRTVAPSRTTAGAPQGTARTGASPAVPVPSGAPGRAQVRLCRALLHGKRVRHGKAYVRLVAAAGGPASVSAYCARMPVAASPERPAGPDDSGRHGADAGRRKPVGKETAGKGRRTKPGTGRHGAAGGAGTKPDVKVEHGKSVHRAGVPSS
ncbi:hypothetical protein [Streptomyces sp. NBC_00344]|uniref:hypothetical protein n=1 Tax=Streptomyces sp. NBC_00344 TaxID=2975720 RepID=UPI002E23767C